ncbi:serine/threonine-protein kinase Sgk2, partial [Blumeria hordei DH14]
MSFTTQMESYLEENPWEETLEEFRTLYYGMFTTPCDTVFGRPKDAKKYLIPARNLIHGFSTYVSDAELFPEISNNITSRLRIIRHRIKYTSFDLAPFEPLASLILSNATDIEVWKSLLQLVDTLESIFASQDEKVKNPAAKSIFRRAGTTQDCTEQKMEKLKLLLRRELHGSVYLNVQGFWKKYFTNKSWVKNCIDLAKEFVKRSAEDDL